MPFIRIGSNNSYLKQLLDLNETGHNESLIMKVSFIGEKNTDQILKNVSPAAQMVWEGVHLEQAREAEVAATRLVLAPDWC